MVVVLVYFIIFVVAFMAALGNPTPTGIMILKLSGALYDALNPLWFIPLAYILGAYFIKVK